MGSWLLGKGVPAGSDIAGADSVALAQLDRVDAERLGDFVHLRLEREVCLRRAVAAEGAGDRCVGVDAQPFDVDVRAAVQRAEGRRRRPR